jgi:hypothetical protein
MTSPENVFTLEALVGTTEVPLGIVPPKRTARIIYGIILNEQSGTVNTITIRQYLGTTLEKSWSFRLNGNATIDIIKDINTPILVIPAGRELRAIASADSVQVILQAYDK